ncbi:MAG: hypothetical protein ACOC3I_08425 [Verrucomicrobiota bacterium]
MMKKDLQTVLRAVVRPAEAPGLSVAEALAQLDALARDPAADLDPHLRHYLQKRSYVKALAFVEDGKTADHG